MTNPFERVEPAKEEPVKLALGDAQPAKAADKSSAVKAAEDTMDLLDTRVNQGKPMSAVVERDYKKIVQEHEKDSQSADDLTIAKAARMRMLQHQMDAGERDKCASGLVDLMKKYPETKNARLVHNIAGHFDLKEDQKFMDAFKANPEPSPDSVRRLNNFSGLNAQEKQAYDKVVQAMDGIAGSGDPAKESEEYQKIIRDNEGNPQSHVGRHIARTARARLIQLEVNNSQDDGNSARKLIEESLKKYPELHKHRSLNISIFALGASGDTPQNQAMIKAYKDAGGDMKKIDQLNRGR